ncbi:MAG TPA: hypothetical protein VIL32_01860 [Steroidobacteraceae bacterium]
MKDLVQAIERTRLDALLSNVERRAESATSLEQKSRVLNLAGDLCFDAEQPERALKYYERAIRTVVSADMYESAVALCRKLIELAPDTVQPGCTLGWLSVTRELVEETKEKVAKYVEAAEEAGLARLARRHRLALADITSAAEVLDAINDNLLRMGREVTPEWVAGQFDRMQGRKSA